MNKIDQKAKIYSCLPCMSEPYVWVTDDGMSVMWAIPADNHCTLVQV